MLSLIVNIVPSIAKNLLFIGFSFLEWTAIDLDVVNEIRRQTNAITKYVQHAVVDTQTNFENVHKGLTELTEMLDNRITSLGDKVDKQFVDFDSVSFNLFQHNLSTSTNLV